MNEIKQNKIKFSNLSANSVPFIPNAYLGPSNSPLSVNVAEFVPSCKSKDSGATHFQSHPESSPKISPSSKALPQCKKNNNVNKPGNNNTREQIFYQSKHDKKLNDDTKINHPSIQKANKSNQTVTDETPYKDDSEFPALSTMSGNDRPTKITLVKPCDFGMSFSDKLKSSSVNEMKEFGNSQHGIHIVINAKENASQRNENKQTRIKQNWREKVKNRNENVVYDNRPWSERVARNGNFSEQVWTGTTKENQNETSSRDRNESRKPSRKKEKSARSVGTLEQDGKRENGKQESVIYDNDKINKEQGEQTARSTGVEFLGEKRGYNQDGQNKKREVKKLGNKVTEQEMEGDNCHARQLNKTAVSMPETRLSSNSKLQHSTSKLQHSTSKTTHHFKQSDCQVEEHSDLPRTVTATKLGIKHNPTKALMANVKPSVMSYSDMLKKQITTEDVTEHDRGILMVSKEQYEYSVGPSESETKTKKKKKKKKKSSETVMPQPVKKTKEPIMFDFGDMLEKLEKKKSVFRTGVVPLSAEILLKAKKEVKVLFDTKSSSANPLDSTRPIIYRKKERETPKKKKPTAMRKIITKDREERKMTRDEKMPDVDDDGAEEKDEDDEEHENVENGSTNEEESPSSDEIKKIIHSRKFREYCDHTLDYDINGAVITLLKELIRFQERLFQKDPVKAKIKRRFVCGLREVYKHVKLKKLKCVIVASNMEPTKSKGSPNDILSNIIDLCHCQNVPVVFSLNRQTLGKVLLKKVPVSIVGIFSYDGAQNHFKLLMTLTEVARQVYQDKFEAVKVKFLLEQNKNDDNEDETKIKEDEVETLSENENEEEELKGEENGGEFETVEAILFSEQEVNLTNETIMVDEGGTKDDK